MGEKHDGIKCGLLLVIAVLMVLLMMFLAFITGYITSYKASSKPEYQAKSGMQVQKAFIPDITDLPKPHPQLPKELLHPWDDKTWSEKIIKNPDRSARFGIAKKPIVFEQKYLTFAGKVSLPKEELETVVRQVFRLMPHVKTNDNTVALVVETAITESDGGYVVWNKHQDAGIFQTKISSVKELLGWIEYKHPDVHAAVMKLRNPELSEKDNLIQNIPYNAAICITYYWRMGGADFTKKIATLEDRAVFWKSVYNTKYGLGTVNDYINRNKNYRPSK